MKDIKGTVVPALTSAPSNEGTWWSGEKARGGVERRHVVEWREGTWWSGDISPHIINFSTKWR